MDPRPDVEALLALPAVVVDGLREAMANADFSEALIGRAEAIAPRQLDPIRLPLVHQWLRALAEPAAIWARLFAYRDRVAESEAREVLGAALLDALLEVGAVKSTDAGLAARLRLMPFAGLVVASDEAPARFDPVMGPGATTLELWRALAVEPGRGCSTSDRERDPWRSPQPGLVPEP